MCYYKWKQVLTTNFFRLQQTHHSKLFLPIKRVKYLQNCNNKKETILCHERFQPDILWCGILIQANGTKIYKENDKTRLNGHKRFFRGQ